MDYNHCHLKGDNDKRRDTTQPFEKKGAKENLFLLLKKYTEDFNKLLSFVLRIQTRDNEIMR